MEFGDFCHIEQKRYGSANELYLHKVIGTLHSNTWVDVPVQTPAEETIHKERCPVVSCICCGISERDVFHYRVDDCKIVAHAGTASFKATIDQLRAQNAALEKKIEDITENAIRLLGSACEKHQKIIEHQSFPEFQASIEGLCIFCLKEQNAALAETVEELSKKLAEKEED